MNLFVECGVLLFLKEIPPDLVCDINRNCASTFIKFLLEKQKFPEVLLLLTRKVSGELPRGAGLLRDCDFSSLDLCSVIPPLSTWDQRKTQLLGCLIDSGGEDAQHSSRTWALGPCAARCRIFPFGDLFDSATSSTSFLE